MGLHNHTVTSINPSLTSREFENQAKSHLTLLKKKEESPKRRYDKKSIRDNKYNKLIGSKQAS